MQFTTLLADALATYRLTKLVIEDEITSELREKAYQAVEGHDKLTYFLGCPWCVSVWAGGSLLLLRKFSPEAADFVSGVLATSAATGILYEKL